MSLDIDVLLSELTLEEKASLTSGSSFWYTTPVGRLGIPKIMRRSIASAVPKCRSAASDSPSSAATCAR